MRFDDGASRWLFVSRWRHQQLERNVAGSAGACQQLARAEQETAKAHRRVSGTGADRKLEQARTEPKAAIEEPEGSPRGPPSAHLLVPVGS